MSNTDISWGQQGWICPKCGCVYAPHVDECRRCNGGNNNAVGTGIISTNPNWIYDPLTDPIRWGSDQASSGNKPISEYEGHPAIITNVQQMLDWFDKATEISEDTITDFFLKKN